MKKLIVVLLLMTMFGVSCDQSHVQQTKTALTASQNGLDKEIRKVATTESDLDLEIRKIMEKGIDMEQRRKQVPAILEAFSQRTTPSRARWLAALCYFKTLGTPLMPLDLAEIALAETGSHGLSGKAVSVKGALGVWQLMPSRAASHGYSPEEMENDEKCADAAVRELLTKLAMAKGNMSRAKKLYCGAGPQADAYVIKIRRFRQEILKTLEKEAGTIPARRPGEPIAS